MEARCCVTTAMGNVSVKEILKARKLGNCAKMTKENNEDTIMQQEDQKLTGKNCKDLRGN